jgi:hypothetical protein
MNMDGEVLDLPKHWSRATNATSGAHGCDRAVIMIKNVVVLATLFFIAVLQVADVLTTHYALQVPGVFESNPVMALAMQYLGNAWWLPKLWVTVLLLAGGFLAMRRRPISTFTFVATLAVAALFFLVILNNLVHFY